MIRAPGHTKEKHSFEFSGHFVGVTYNFPEPNGCRKVGPIFAELRMEI